MTTERESLISKGRPPEGISPTKQKIRLERMSSTMLFMLQIENEGSQMLSDMREQLLLLLPVINDLPGGIIKLGDLVNSVSRKPIV
jgi:hypothetical protein